MPGRHAPESPSSFYLSLGKALGGSLAAVGLMVLAVVVVFGGRGGKPAAFPTVSGPSPSPKASATTAPPTPVATERSLPPSKVTVAVMNGTDRKGLAAREQAKFTAAGYQVVQVGNATSVATSTIYYRPGAHGEAAAFQHAFPQFTVLAQSSQIGDVLLRVVIGGDYP